MYRCILALLLLALSQVAVADVHFRVLNSEVGSITDVTFDQHGLMWFGSRQGLYRYDGTRLQQVSSAQGLSDDDIRKVVVGPDNELWVAMNSGGLNIYQPKSGEVQIFRQGSEADTLSNDSVYDIAFLPDGSIWVATQSGLNRFDPNTGTFKRYFHDASTPQSLASNYAFSLYVDQRQRLWITTLGGGVSRYDPDVDAFKNVSLHGHTGQMQSDDVFAMLQVDAERFLFGTRAGVFLYNDVRQSVTPVLYEGQATGIATDIAAGAQALYVATLRHGVLAFHAETDRLSPLNRAPLGSENQLPAVPIFDMDVFQSQLFMGTWGKGLYAAFIEDSGLQAKLIQPTDEGATSNITALTNSPEGLLAGSFGNGVKRVHEHIQSLEMDNASPLHAGYRHLLKRYPELGNIGVLATSYSAAHQRLYLGTVEGLWIADLRAGALTKYRRLNERNIGYVNALAVQPNGDVWFGSGGEGLMLLEHRNDLLIAFNAQPQSQHQLVGDYVTALELDQHHLWVGTRSNGLSRCTMRPVRCQHIDEMSTTTPHFNITAIRKLSSGAVAFTTRGGGLYEYNPATQAMLQVNEAVGLNSNITLSVEEDSDGSLWVSSSAGLSRINAERNGIYNYPINALVGLTHFNADSSAGDAQEHLYFGALEGVVQLTKGTDILQHHGKTLLLSGEVRNKEQMTSVAAGEGVNKVAPESVIKLEFALLDYLAGPKDYQYRLTQTQPWQSVGQGQQLLLHHLAAGYYQIQIRSRDHAGLWQYSAPLALRVDPYFWQTWWFQCLILVAGLSLIWWLHRRRTARLAQRNRDLVRLQQQKQHAREQERQHISRELHDEIGQSLTACKLSLQMQHSVTEDVNAKAKLAGTVALVEKIIHHTRDLTRSLRPPQLDDVGLFVALDNYLETLRDCSDVTLTSQWPSELTDAVQAHSELIFRVVQEAVNNALKHAQARSIHVSISYDTSAIEVEVRDDGCGIDSKERRARMSTGQHLGLLGMRERLYEVKGSLTVTSAAGKGCTVRARIPL